MAEFPSLAPIRALSSDVINQIAAGEVVERPAAVLRELLDNALDAGATSIVIQADNGGIDRLSVRDDGHGIPADQLRLALERHATSKIRALDDLERIATLGFRGEALPSIAAVADLRICSRTQGADSAWQVACGPGLAAADPQPQRGVPGTEVEMRELFARVPARRKFLRSPRTEWTHIEALARRTALSCPRVAFRLEHNGKDVWTRPAESLSARVDALIGADFRRLAMPVEARQGPWHLYGLASQPAWSRVQADTQYVFLNGRYLRDRLIVGALRAAYAEVLHGARQPGYVLFLDGATEGVDVNVHPTKQEVRFRDGQEIFRFLRGSVLEAIRQPLSVDPPLQDKGATAPPQARHHGPAVAPAPPSQDAAGKMAERWAVAEPTPPLHAAAVYGVASGAARTAEAARAGTRSSLADPGPGTQFALAETPPLGFALGQLHQTYIVAQNTEGLVLVDMHAAHERIVLEQLKRSLDEQTMRAQPLLVPLEMRASPAELAALDDAQAWLLALGMDVRETGPAQMAVLARPQLLDRYDLEQLVRDVLADVHASEGVDIHRLEYALDRALGNHACKAGSIKHGRVLTHPEMNALLRQIESTPRSGQCNHGRPTWRLVALDELDGWFLRGR